MILGAFGRTDADEEIEQMALDRASRPAPSADFVQSLARGLAVIRTFDAEHAQLSLSEVARRAGITRAAAGRFLRTLQKLGYVRSSGRLFSLTPLVLELGFSYLSALSLPEIVQPHLERLSREVDESVSTAILSGTDVVYVARVPTRRIMRVGITIGTRFPAYVTSMGRVLLANLPAQERADVLAQLSLERVTEHTIADAAALIAELDRVRAQGWALVNGELEIGLRSIAVPVHQRDGSVVAAINLSTSVTQVTQKRVMTRLLPRLQETAAAIDADLALL
jgi:IclR family pca regulon transcriptional regulator